MEVVDRAALPAPAGESTRRYRHVLGPAATTPTAWRATVLRRAPLEDAVRRIVATRKRVEVMDGAAPRRPRRRLPYLEAGSCGAQRGQGDEPSLLPAVRPRRAGRNGSRLTLWKESGERGRAASRLKARGCAPRCGGMTEPGLRRARDWPRCRCARWRAQARTSAQGARPRLDELRETSAHRVRRESEAVRTASSAFERMGKRCPASGGSARKVGKLLTFRFPNAQWKPCTTNSSSATRGSPRRVTTQSSLPTETGVILLFSLVAIGQIRLVVSMAGGKSPRCCVSGAFAA